MTIHLLLQLQAQLVINKFMSGKTLTVIIAIIVVVVLGFLWKSGLQAPSGPETVESDQVDFSSDTSASILDQVQGMEADVDVDAELQGIDTELEGL